MCIKLEIIWLLVATAYLSIRQCISFVISY